MLRAAGFVALGVAGLAFLGLLGLGCGCFGATAITAARFSELRANDPSGLRAFLHPMPKGADLHVHLSGAIYAEDFIAWAAREKLCYQISNQTNIPPPCVAALIAGWFRAA